MAMVLIISLSFSCITSCYHLSSGDPTMSCCFKFQLYVADQLPAPLIIRYGRRMGLVVEREMLK